MRNLEDIEQDLAQAKEALTRAEGRPAEVYSRIVGYYRSVRNWNRGKKEEYQERKVFHVSSRALPEAEKRPGPEGERLLLFVRPACPACPGAKAAAGRLGIPVDLVNADTEKGLAEAARRQVFSTPTAILLSPEGKELDRARDALTIAAWGGKAASL
jgi:ribonucleoside-triphosphate reductase